MGLDTFHSTILGDLLTSCDIIERSMLHPTLENRHPAAQIFMHSLPPIPGTTERDFKYLQVLFSSAVQQLVAESGARVLKLRISKIEVKVWVATSPPTALRLVSEASMGWEAMAFQETLDVMTGSPASFKNVETAQVCSSLEMLRPPAETHRSSKRAVARRAGSTYIYDFPALFRVSLTKMWMKVTDKVPSQLVVARELVLEGGELVERDQTGKNRVGMVVWQCTFTTPEYPEGRDIILVGNDVTTKAGSFGVEESEVFFKASELARKKGIPRIYIACNSGARIGGVEELKQMLQVEWVDPKDLLKGFKYLYVSDEDFKKLPAQAVEAHSMTVDGKTRHVLDAIMGVGLPSVKGGVGVECLQGSGLIAGETSRAYDETFTLSYATGRSVGIGAYLNRLGQRNIQMVNGPMILTGADMLNKVLGQQVYTSLDQLGGPHIMVPNGVTHELVQNDQDGVEAILRWLSYVPECVNAIPPVISSRDPVSRKVQFTPTKTPYDPRHMLGGVKVDGEWQGGFCDEGSFHEYLAGWGKSVVIGRGRLGGLPIGIVSVETRSVERHIPADPQEPSSSDVIEVQAGQVWYPDSAYKTATAIRDFNRGEQLPLVIFANWRGFSGGTRDMFGEVLKYGSMIVDALVEYKQPVTIYIPPNGELRGGAWVVLDPKINSEQIEMFADVDARGGILEPPAAAEVLFKKDKHTVEMMHRCDDTLKQLDARQAKGEDVKKDIEAREKLLLPVYQQVAIQYCDLHDRAPRMKSVGAIREGLEWANSREYLHWRIRRRMQENCAARQLMRLVPDMSYVSAVAVVTDLCKDVAAAAGPETEDRAVATWIEEHPDEVRSRVEAERHRAAEKEIYKLVSSLPGSKRAEVLRDLVGYSHVAAAQ
jgi:acetyl-CoA carboxylase/biotin carboxylase 1